MKWVKALLCFLGCIVVFVLATSLTIRFLLRDDSSVTCPNLTGLDIEEAKHLADRQGLSVFVVKYEKRKDMPYNRVLVQKPDASTPVRSGRAVSVILSDGPKPQPIPDVTGLDGEGAAAKLQENNIPVKKTLYVPSESIGKVLAQIPSAGQNILDEGGMTLIVGGRERRLFLMPDVAAGDVTSAIEEMERKGIKYTLGPAQPETAKGVPSKTRTLPNTIFNEDAVIELPAPITAGG